MKATVTVTVDKTVALPAGSNPFANILLTLTDAAGDVQTATVDGTETPAWVAEFDDISTTPTGGGGTVTAQAQDAGGVAIGAPISQSFTEAGTGTGTGGTFPSPTALSVAVS